MLKLQLELRRGGFTGTAELAAPAGEITVLFGPSGAGKSSLLRAIAGLDRARGVVRVGDSTWQDAAGDVWLPPHRRRVGMVFQEARLLPHLSVAGQLAFVARRRATVDRIPAVSDQLDLDELMDRSVGTLSGGERQRVAVARALLADPAVMLLDEPFSSVDRRRRADLFPLIETAVRDCGAPTILVTHSLTELGRLADHVVPMSDGRTGGALTPAAAVSEFAGGAEDALALLEGQVTAAADPDGLVRVRVGEHELLVQDRGLPVGASLRLQIRAHDVSLTVDRAARTSILNILPGSVVSIREEPGADALVGVDIGGHVLFARISRRSVRQLDLVPGRPIHAQVKAMAVS
ncbi:MAG: molybdenum ABC transporter ATP-binding protein [Pseudomonadota bacterium]